MKLIDRYIIREVSSYTLLGVGVFAFVLMTPELLRLSELLARESMSAADIGLLFLSVLPPKLVWALPLAVLVGLLMGVSRLGADRELIALQTAGIGLFRLLRPALLFAFTGTVVTLAVGSWWGPSAARTLRRLQAELGSRQAFYEVQPRVFEERFPNRILYVQDVEQGGTSWRGVFLADVSPKEGPTLTFAQSGVAVPSSQGNRIRLQLRDGITHESVPGQPERYSLSTFSENSISMAVPQREISLEVKGNAELNMRQLWKAAQDSDQWRLARADFHRRLALPAACLAFGLLAFPLGLMTQQSGRATGFVLAVVLAIGYYFLFLLGDRFGREGKIPPTVGVWVANFALLVLAAVLIARLRRPRGGTSLTFYLRQFASGFHAWRLQRSVHAVRNGPNDAQKRRLWSSRPYFPRTLDLYVVRGVLFHFFLVEVGLLLLFGLFSVLEMVDDIAAREIPWVIVGRFLWYLLPQAFYWMTPLALLLAVLVELTLLSTRNELVAIKGAGISLYRVIAPVLLVALLFSSLLFWLDSTYLPEANQQQEALRNYIKGRPPQTFFQTERRWVFGKRAQVYHYAFFDPVRDLLARLEVLELDVDHFSMQRRLYAERAHWEPQLNAWVLEKGWERVFDGDRTLSYRSFDVAAFPELAETPAYFKKEVRESAQMDWRELSAYIRELRQSGLDTTRLTVQWHKKFSFPAIAAVMVLLAFPFGLAGGRRGGAVGGLAVGIAIGISYWVLAGFFEALGNFGLLPPVLAGWGPNTFFTAGGIYLVLHADT